MQRLKIVLNDTRITLNRIIELVTPIKTIPIRCINSITGVDQETKLT